VRLISSICVAQPEKKRGEAPSHSQEGREEKKMQNSQAAQNITLRVRISHLIMGERTTVAEKKKVKQEIMTGKVQRGRGVQAEGKRGKSSPTQHGPGRGKKSSEQKQSELEIFAKGPSFLEPRRK